ncbi:intermembrane transport protein PqiB [Mycoavidus sp. B2-EB]|uniref:PqiB family protein n=1 Tax=Mycoavidus sp. B2-EB TaxID=2651972 RepID=UPI0016294411|nr:MlaD family protein [Mycoavidus sp. B2-EB]BBO60230.1 paraquat-inducible protein [Mycoavidus sp. B2-EB]
MTKPKTRNSNSAQQPLAARLPTPVVEPRGRWVPSLVWLIPLLAALIGIGLAGQAILASGPTIVISFKTAEGLEPGITKVKYKDVEIGEVKEIKLSKDLSQVLVEVELTRNATSFAVTDTRFWVVRPRIAANGVSGLNTLLSGSYIGVDAGQANQVCKDFIGLETPPAITGDQKGQPFTLHSDTLGSLDIGSPVYYRRVPVGRVVASQLDKDGRGVTLSIFIHAPYDQYVRANTRFWHASGINLNLNANGFDLNTQSLVAMFIGGIAFQTPPGQTLNQAAPNNSHFQLAADEADAMQGTGAQPIRIVFNFAQSLRGLSVGAPVDFRGITLGQVESIGVDYNPKTHTLRMPVTAILYPDRLSQSFAQAFNPKGQEQKAQLLTTLSKRGLRAQLRTGNLLTGQLYVALDMFPKAAPVKFDPTRQPFELPTLPNTLDQLQLQVTELVRKLDKIPFDEIGLHLNSTLKRTNHLLQQLETQLAPQARDMLLSAQKTFDAANATLQQGSPLQTDIHQALTALTRTLQSLNALADYIERHPEALIHGKSRDN